MLDLSELAAFSALERNWHFFYATLLNRAAAIPPRIPHSTTNRPKQPLQINFRNTNNLPNIAAGIRKPLSFPSLPPPPAPTRFVNMGKSGLPDLTQKHWDFANQITNNTVVGTPTWIGK